MIDWQPKARALADELADAGHVRTGAWRTAFAAVPRHVFVPVFFEQGDPGHWRRVDSAVAVHRDHWMKTVYSNTTLVTALEHLTLPNNQRFAVAVSSSTEPGLMAQLLEDLAVDTGHTVLEIGTGTGYSAALLCERLSASEVYSVDLRPDQIDTAAHALCAAGHRPTLATTNGANGLPDHAPYDRIIATCSVQYIPPAWIEQLRPGGKLLADVEGTIYAGNLVELHRRNEAAVDGRFMAEYGSFMPMQHDTSIDPGPSYPTDQKSAATRTTTLNPHLLHERHDPFAFFAQLHLPPGTQLQKTAINDCTRLVTPGGSWCETSNKPDSYGNYNLTEGGPQRLWHLIEQAQEHYAALGNPTWERFGLTATLTQQSVWLDDPDNQRWPIAMTGTP